VHNEAVGRVCVITCYWELTWYRISILIGMFGYESVLDVPPANAVRPQQHQSLPLEGRIGHCQHAKSRSLRCSTSHTTTYLATSRPPRTLLNLIGQKQHCASPNIYPCTVSSCDRILSN
jgi:hypothetical protein